MAGMKARAILPAAEGGRRLATTEPSRWYDPSMCSHLPSWETPLPPSDEEPEGDEFPTFPLASGSTQLLSQMVLVGGEASRTVITAAHASARGLQQPRREQMGPSTVRGGASVVGGVGSSPAARQHVSGAPSGERFMDNWDVRTAAATSSLRTSGARSSMLNRTTAAPPEGRDKGARKPPAGSGARVEKITRGVSNMRAHSDGGDDDGCGGDDANDGLREEVEAGDDDDDNAVWPVGKTGGRGIGCSNRGGRGRSVGRGGRGGVTDDGGKSGTYWSTDEQKLLVRCKREQEMHLVGLGHNYGRMRTKEWKWIDIAKRMANGGSPKKADNCMKKWDNLFQNYKKIQSPDGVQLPRRGAGGEESVDSEGGGDGCPEERSSARDPNVNACSVARGGKRKNACQQALESIADVMDRHGKPMSSTIESSSKRALKRMLPLAPEAQQARGRDARKDKAVVVVAEGDDNETLERRRQRNLAQDSAAPLMTTRLPERKSCQSDTQSRARRQVLRAGPPHAPICGHTIDLNMDLPLWFAGAHINDRPDDDDMAVYQESTVICIAQAFRAAVQMGAHIDSDFISYDHLCRVGDCFRLLLAAAMWIMRMAGDDFRSHYEAFYSVNLLARPTLVASMHRSFDHRRSIVRAAKAVTERLGKANPTFGEHPNYIPQWAPCGITFGHDASVTGPEDCKRLDWLGSGPPDDDGDDDKKEGA
ncbi:hypothetical protein CBR_g19862 [Chara braunii]|uniref:Myb-like domain-containing protein n=1 Tax=Chara braunii TaxID=69332 RepID=A0A388KYT7_CHABU|nr:hypothetical protein CBR_g19862 [Chara braunii]|eukprot:GBG75226.1 hypothetical protein CBR_g19862 [Chara braunii]